MRGRKDKHNRSEKCSFKGSAMRKRAMCFVFGCGNRDKQNPVECKERKGRRDKQTVKGGGDVGCFSGTSFNKYRV